MILFETLLPLCHIAEINPSFSHLGNGVAYSFVEVTCRDGIQYGLQAFGKVQLWSNRNNIYYYSPIILDSYAFTVLLCIFSYFIFIINKVIFRPSPAALVPIMMGSDLISP